MKQRYGKHSRLVPLGVVDNMSRCLYKMEQCITVITASKNLNNFSFTLNITLSFPLVPEHFNSSGPNHKYDICVGVGQTEITCVRAGSVKMPDLLKNSNNTANACHKRRS